MCRLLQLRVVLVRLQVQAEQALQNITGAMQQASGHSQEAAQLKKQLADDQVCSYIDLRLSCMQVVELPTSQISSAAVTC